LENFDQQQSLYGQKNVNEPVFLSSSMLSGSVGLNSVRESIGLNSVREFTNSVSDSLSEIHVDESDFPTSLLRNPLNETQKKWIDAKTNTENWNLSVSMELEKMKRIVSETHKSSSCSSTAGSMSLSDISVSSKSQSLSTIRKETVTTPTPQPRTTLQGRLPKKAKNQNQEKLLCTFFVNIPNDRVFLVTRKIIGPNGSHMKNIAKICPNTKLRLRGKGSGYRDSQDKTESNVPLQINVSCSSNVEEYENSKQEVAKLLNGIYAEYRECTGGKIVNFKLHENKKKNASIAV
jgi:hypothetical protein